MSARCVQFRRGPDRACSVGGTPHGRRLDGLGFGAVCEPDHIPPVLDNKVTLDRPAHQRCQKRPVTRGFEVSQFSIRKVAQMRRKFHTKQTEQREDVIRDAPSIGMVHEWVEQLFMFSDYHAGFA